MRADPAEDGILDQVGRPAADVLVVGLGPFQNASQKMWLHQGPSCGECGSPS